MLEAVPNLRDELREANARRAAKLLEAFDVTATYDKADHQLHLASTVPAELVSEGENPDRPRQSVGEFVHSAGGI